MKFFAKTDFGLIRQINQDYYIAESRKIGIFPNLFIVADGVGSNRESGFASKHCADFVLDQLSLSKDSIDYKAEIDRAYRLANTDLVYRIMANPSYSGMGTTMVCMTIIGSRGIIANIGDSRCYHLREDIVQITKDHSMAEELVREKAINRDSEKYKELKSQLSRAFGAGKTIKPDFFDINLSIGDYVLLCSDGLYNMVDNKKILEIIKRDTNMETKVNDLIDEANANGGKDNIAIILIYIDSLETKDVPPATIISSNMKEILNARVESLNGNFRSRSRKKKEGENDVDK